MKRTLQPLLIWPAPVAGAASVLKPNHAASNPTESKGLDILLCLTMLHYEPNSHS